MRMRFGLALTLSFCLAHPVWAVDANLLPNGNVESEWVNLVHGSKGYARHIQARDTGLPSFWRVSEGASRVCDVTHSGDAALRLKSGKKPATATVFSDYWRVKDKAMPFGTPLLPGIPVDITFFYRTTTGITDGAVKAVVTLGVIPGLSSQVREVSLTPTSDWREVSLSMTPTELLWGAQIDFALEPPDSEDQAVWIDDVSAKQDVGEPTNLVRNPGFEVAGDVGVLPPGWEAPIEDQWVSWVGARYRPPMEDAATAASGWRSLRATATYAEISGFSQDIRLDQDSPRPVMVCLRSKLNNAVGSAPPGYYGPDNLPNLTIYVYHVDGTMQEVSPTFCLGESDHDWRYFRAGFLPQKPVERLRLQVTLIGMEATTSLWVDDVAVHEVQDSSSSVRPYPSERRAPSKTLVSSWGDQANVSRDRVTATNDSTRLFLAMARPTGVQTTLVYLSPDWAGVFPDYHRFLYHVVRIAEDGKVELGTAVEKQGYTAVGEFQDGAALGIHLDLKDDGYAVAIPLAAIGRERPTDQPLGFNVQWETSERTKFWTGRGAATSQLGALILAPPPGVAVQSLRFGNRWELEPDMAQDFVSHPQMNAGRNRAELVLQNHGASTQVRWKGGVRGRVESRGTVDMAAGETCVIPFDYDAGAGRGVADFELALESSTTSRALVTPFPLEVPPCVEAVLDHEFYFPEETTAKLEVHNRLRPWSLSGQLTVTLAESETDAVLWSREVSSREPVTTIEVPIEAVRVNDLPVQDHEVRIVLHDEHGAPIATEKRRFGRIRHTVKRPIPPIETVKVDDEGRVVLNGHFRFFPIMPSLSSDAPVEAVHLGANVCRAYFREGKTATLQGHELFEAVEEAWNANAYTMTIGPAPSSMDQFDRDGPKLLAHPGFLGCYGMQFYYWKLPEEYLTYRYRLESAIGAAPSPRLVVWGHHDSSFLYDLGRPNVTSSPAPLGYCYVKIMGRPGPAWRNAPFLTRTEQVLDPKKFKLAEVNYYVSWHDDEIVPEHFKTYRSMRADDWRGFRNESYLSVIYGADGLYHYICVQKGGLQRLRGWFQELNHMWPVFVADDSARLLRVSPADSGVEVRLKEWEGKLYLLTANAYERTRNAAIAIEGIEGWSVRKLFDLPGAMRVHGNVIEDTWNTYDAHVYELTEAALR